MPSKSCAIIAALLLASAGCAVGQLPDAPSAQRASLVGTVEDTTGSLLPGARIEIASGAATVVAFADDDGVFHAYGVAPGPYTLRITAHGFFAQTSTGSTLPGEEKELEPVELAPSGDNASVTVVASVHEVAAAQVAAAEKQRVMGVVPNFYVVYDKDPAPLSAGQKFHLTWRSTIDPVSVLAALSFAGIEQASDQFSGYGSGASGYGKRFGATFADGAISGLLGGAILPSIFHQDPRYRYQGTGSTASRVRHAIGSIVVCRGDNNRTQFNYSNVIGTFASAGISNLYYPASDRHGAGLTMQNAAIGTAFGAFAAIMQEFVVPHFTPHLPKRAGGGAARD